jgi:PAS domain S-box-containing protein
MIMKAEAHQQDVAPQQSEDGGTEPTSNIFVGIGVSARGLPVVQQFLGALSADSGMVFVIILHPSADHESNVGTLLQQHTAMPVLQVTEPIPIAPNHVYLIPSTKQVSIADGILRLSDAEGPGDWRTPAALVVHISDSTVDTTERKRVEQELRSSEEQLRLLIESVQDYAIFTVNPDNRVDSWNPGAERILGYTEEEIIGRNSAILFTPQDRAEGVPEQEMRTALAEGRAADERWHVRMDGTRFFASGEMTLVRDDEGTLRGYVKIMQDLTERKHTQETVRASEERQRLLIDSVQDYAIFTVNTEGRIDSWNPGAERTFGYREQEIIGQEAAIIFTPEDRANAVPEQELRTAQVAGRAADERWHLRKDGARFYASGVTTAIRDAEGNLRGFVKITRDLTSQKQAEERLQRAHDTLEERVQDRTTELADANAQLQEALRAVVTAQEDERRRVARELHDQLGQSVSALRLGLATLTDLAQPRTHPPDTVTRLQQLAAQLDEDVDRLALQLRPSALDDLGLLAAVQQYVDEWSERNQIPTDIQINGLEQARLPAELEIVVYRVIQEALTNVTKHANAQYVSIVLERRSDQVRLIVEDDGRGFDAEPMQHSRDVERRLGLLGMRERVALANGTFTLESTPERGTSIFVRIPILSEREEDTSNA